MASCLQVYVLIVSGISPLFLICFYSFCTTVISIILLLLIPAVTFHIAAAVCFDGLTEALLGLDPLRSCNAFTSKTSKNTYFGESIRESLVAYSASLTATILRESHSKTSA